jgi:hypothetical protein
VLVVSVGKVENRLLKVLDFVGHVFRLDIRTETGEVVDGTLAVCGSDNVFWVLADVLCNFAPCGLDGSDRVGQSAVLKGYTVSMIRERRCTKLKKRTMSKRTASARTVLTMLSRREVKSCY